MSLKLKVGSIVSMSANGKPAETNSSSSNRFSRGNSLRSKREKVEFAPSEKKFTTNSLMRSSDRQR